MAPVSLKAVDRVEILSVMDNTIDVLMGNTAVAKRHQRGSNAHARPQLRADGRRVGVGAFAEDSSDGADDARSLARGQDLIQQWGMPKSVQIVTQPGFTLHHFVSVDIGRRSICFSRIWKQSP